MKIPIIIAGSVLLATAAACTLLAVHRRRGRDEPGDPCIDGGVRRRIDKNAPKKIMSTEITDFKCTVHTASMISDDPYMTGTYIFEMERKNGKAFAKYSFRNRYDKSFKGEFVPDGNFTKELYRIVSVYDFASQNGIFYSVSGLPPGFGSEISVDFASGESISASNNQSSFISMEAVIELYSLFRGYSTGSSLVKWDSITVSCNHPVSSRCFNISISKNNGDMVICGYLFGPDGTEHFSDEGTPMSEDGIRAIAALSLENVSDRNNRLTLPFHADDKETKKLVLTLDGKETEKEYDDEIVSEIRRIVLPELELQGL
ncbi:MAG: hypothetical protein E7578_06590 [Ruminococcaceae bacterium]|nr:hypothetical protein [Oscillospiraceae bacterium]